MTQKTEAPAGLYVLGTDNRIYKVNNPEFLVDVTDSQVDINGYGISRQLAGAGGLSPPGVQHEGEVEPGQTPVTGERSVCVAFEKLDRLGQMMLRLAELAGAGVGVAEPVVVVSEPIASPGSGIQRLPAPGNRSDWVFLVE